MSNLMHPAQTHLVLVLWMTLLTITAPLIQGILSSVNGLRHQAQVHPMLILWVDIDNDDDNPFDSDAGDPKL